jgi:hypothetical protein
MSEGITRLLDDLADNEATGERVFGPGAALDWQRQLDILQSAVLEVARSHERVSPGAGTG